MKIFGFWRSRLAPALNLGVSGIALSFACVECASGQPMRVGEVREINNVPFLAQAPGRDGAIEVQKDGQINFSVLPGEKWEGDVEKGNKSSRAELSAQRKVFFGDHTSARFSMEIVQLDQSPGQRQSTLVQLHGPNKTELADAPDLQPPPFQMRAKNGAIDLAVRSGSVEDGLSKETIIGTLPFDVGQWHDYQVGIQLGDATNGRVTVTRDGEVVADYRGPVGYEVGRSAHYWKFGIYQYGQHNEASLVDFNHVDFGN